MQLLIPLGEEIELSMALPYRVPVAFPELGTRTIYHFDRGQIGDTDFVWTSSDEGSMLLVQSNHGAVHVAIPTMFRDP